VRKRASVKGEGERDLLSREREKELPLPPGL